MSVAEVIEDDRTVGMGEIRKELLNLSEDFALEFSTHNVHRKTQTLFPIIQELLFRTSGLNGFRDADWNNAEKIALMHSEVSEAWDAIDNHLMDDKLVHIHGASCEFADTVIRAMDYAQHHRIDLTVYLNISAVHIGHLPKAHQISEIHGALSRALEEVRTGGGGGQGLADAVLGCLQASEAYPVPLAEVIIAKAVYNTTRPYKHGKNF